LKLFLLFLIFSFDQNLQVSSGPMQQSLTTKIETLAGQLKVMGMRVATAESCTGGGIAQTLTAIAGSSEWFECGFVTYSNASKQSMLGVQPAILDEQGAVSEAVVAGMAVGALARSEAQLAVAVSGVAGPGGGSEDKPVGTVWLAWLLAGQPVNSRCFHFKGDREAVRYQAVEAAIDGLLSQLAQNTKS
jgi:nicotinamide-nucleotide amidase